jgi:hypothetical protein
MLLVASVGLLAIGPLSASPQGSDAGHGGPVKSTGTQAGGSEKAVPPRGGTLAPTGNEKVKPGKPVTPGKPLTPGKPATPGKPGATVDPELDGVIPLAREGKARGSMRAEDMPVFRDYFAPFRDKPLGLPPGIARQVREGKGLPPGWKDKVVPGSLLDDALWGALVPLPTDLRRDLPRTNDSRYFIMHDQLVRIHPTERRVLGIVAVTELAEP